MRTNENVTVNITNYENTIIIHTECLNYGTAKQSKREIMLENRKTQYNGFMSACTKRKVKTIITSWYKSIEHGKLDTKNSKSTGKRKLTFATLTLSDEQKHTDKFIKRKLLNRFLVEAKRRFNYVNYLWKAEKQKNGRIHFHIILDTYISNPALQLLWNSIQSDFGYLDNFFFTYKRYNPPSTHITQITSGKLAIEYILKYVGKVAGNSSGISLKIEGRIWGCSDALKNLKPFRIAEDSRVIELLYKLSNHGKIEMFNGDYFTVFNINSAEFYERHFPDYHKLMIDYYATLFNSLYDPDVNFSSFAAYSEPEKSVTIIEYIQGSLDIDCMKTRCPTITHFND